MHKIDIKPASVNDVWQGRRYRNDYYKAYQTAVNLLLPKLIINPLNRLKITLEFGFSNKLSDIDNPIKPILDIMQKKWGFNDNMVYELNVSKKIVKKGEEYIKYEITELKF